MCHTFILLSLPYPWLCRPPATRGWRHKREPILHDVLRFPKGENRQVSESAKSFLRGLLQRRVVDRLGSTNGAEELKQSAFFSELDFERVYTKSVKAKFVPPLMRSDSDVRNFDLEFTREKPVDSVVTSQMSDTLQEKTNFEGFTFEGGTVPGRIGAEKSERVLA